MAERKSPQSQSDLDERIHRLREEQDGGRGKAKSAHSGLGFAMRVGVELVAALVIGVVVGLMLDRWLETKPWFMLAFFVLGAMAGIFNVFRVVKRHDSAIGYRAETDKDRNGE